MKINQIFLIMLIFLKVKTAPSDNCYDFFSDYCYRCDDSYGLKEDGTCSNCESGKTGYYNYCYSTIQNCEYYGLFVEGEKCRQCKDGYALNEEFTQCNKCNDGETSGGYKCHKKIDHCKYYNHHDYSCSRCEDNYYLSENQCIACGTNQRSEGRVCYDKISNCDSYSEDSCNSCSNDKPYILTTGGTQCNECTAYGKYFYNNKCIDEIKYCFEYSSETECSRCKIGYKISGGKCLPCVEPYAYYQSDGKKCYLEHLDCEDHDNEGNCISCEEGYSLNSSKGCTKNNAGGANIHNSFNFKINILAVLFFILL